MVRDQGPAQVVFAKRFVWGSQRVPVFPTVGYFPAGLCLVLPQVPSLHRSVEAAPSVFGVRVSQAVVWTHRWAEAEQRRVEVASQVSPAQQALQPGSRNADTQGRPQILLLRKTHTAWFSTPESPSEDYINMARTECRARRRCHCGTQKYSDCSTAIGRLE